MREQRLALVIGQRGLPDEEERNVHLGLDLWQAFHNSLEARLARSEVGVMVDSGGGGVSAE